VINLEEALKDGRHTPIKSIESPKDIYSIGHMN